MPLDKSYVETICSALKTQGIVLGGDATEIANLGLPEDYMVIWELHGDPRKSPRIESTWIGLDTGNGMVGAIVERTTLADSVRYRAGFSASGNLEDVREWTTIDLDSE